MRAAVGRHPAFGTRVPDARAAWGLTMLLVACASPGMPPGGPPDDAVPVIRRITPDSNAVNVSTREVLIFFDEVISERPGAAGQASGSFGGGADLSSIVSISPSDGRDEVTWRRTAVEIRPRRGFRPNTAYRVTIQPGVSDLRGNVLASRTEFVFSTGPGIPTGEVRGAVFDWAQARPAAQARVEVYPPEDSTFRWSARADSLGRYVIRDLTPGTYRLRAWVDANNDRRVGSGEAMDTASITLGQSASADLYAFPHDTLAPRLERVTPVDSTALTLRFDRVVAGDWDPRGAITLEAADSTQIALAGTAVPAAQYDSLRRAAEADTATAADSAATADVVEAERAPVGNPARAGASVDSGAAGIDSAAAANDTTRAGRAAARVRTRAPGAGVARAARRTTGTRHLPRTDHGSARPERHRAPE